MGHHLITGLGADLVAVKAVGIFHDELATTHQAKAWAPLIAELGLNLIEIFGQLFVAAQVLTGDVGHHLLAGGLDDEIPLVAVADAQQFGAHLVKAPGFLPVLGGLDHGHRQLDRTGTVHFLSNNGFHLVDDAQPHRHVRVDARAQLFDHARPGHELVADHLGIGGRFFESGNEELRGFHGMRSGPLRSRLIKIRSGKTRRRRANCHHHHPKSREKPRRLITGMHNDFSLKIWG